MNMKNYIEIKGGAVCVPVVIQSPLLCLPKLSPLFASQVIGGLSICLWVKSFSLHGVIAPTIT